ncbi:MAG: 50S ribosomal protein L25 [Patescibacteria group bacterium]
MLTLEVTERSAKDSLSQLRSKGLMPAVFYGKKTPSTSISVPQRTFIKLWKKAGESTVVSLKTQKGELLVLVHDVDLDPVTDIPRHADFYVFEKGDKIKVKVPIEFIGSSPAVKELGGVLIKVLYDLEIEAEPTNLPHHIEIDISSLTTFGSHITAKDITLPEGVFLAVSPDDVIVSVTEPKEEKVEETLMDITDIEVEKKGKEPTAEEGTPEAAVTAAPKAPAPKAPKK